ncbi:MAG TPA: toxin-antitoxin system, toxin component, HicA family protein [Lachnospiraceae bacterium]|jgi:mRNA interferase HicA|nr:toxin-antitoxin system, toxin component, HicA family protein [Lachnospiraceae bacterium]HCX41588.1 toxin-antitoxin system, toxin component, HicA family protein [Lachnospiraceae bacterium]
MNRSDLVKQVEKNGYWLLRHGASHDIYTNGKRNETIPRHKEIDEQLAKIILKKTGN